MLVGWISTLDRLAVRTSTCVLDPFWFALKCIALAENWNCPFKLKTDGFTCYLPYKPENA